MNSLKLYAMQRAAIIVVMALAPEIATFGQGVKGIPIAFTAREIIQQSPQKYYGEFKGGARIAVETEDRQERNGIVRESKSRMLAKVQMASRDRSRVEASNWEGEVLRVVDGRLLSLYFPVTKTYSNYTADSQGNQPKLSGEDANFNLLAESVIEAMATLDYPNFAGRGMPEPPTLLREEDLDVEGRKIKCYLIEVKSKPAADSEWSRLHWIEKSSYLVWRSVSTIRRKMASGSVRTVTTTTSFSELASIPTLPAETFTFNAPPEARPSRIPIVSGSERARSRVAVGAEAPDFTLRDLDGKSVSLKSLRGKAVFINLWATWCGPCRVEMPLIEELFREYKDKDVAFLAVSSEETEVIREFFQQQKYTFSSLVDTEGTVSSIYGTNAIPVTVLVGRGGRIVENLLGARKEAEFRAAIEKALKSTDEAPAAIPRRISWLESPSTKPAGCLPQLVKPTQGASLPNRTDETPVNWMFQWTDCPGTARYHLQIWEPKATSSFFEYNGLLSLNYAFPLNQKLPEASAGRGWRWRVRGQVNGVWGEWVESHFDITPSAAKSPDLAAPVMISPVDKSTFNQFPRQTVFNWRPLAGAVSYRVEIDHNSGGAWAGEYNGIGGVIVNTSETTITHSFVGAQPGRWRVWGIDSKGREGPKSPWWIFFYTR